MATRIIESCGLVQLSFGTMLVIENHALWCAMHDGWQIVVAIAKIMVTLIIPYIYIYIYRHSKNY